MFDVRHKRPFPFNSSNDFALHLGLVLQRFEHL